jgi:hypothetical protein
MRGWRRHLRIVVPAALAAMALLEPALAQTPPERDAAEFENNGIVAWPIVPFGGAVSECRAIYGEEMEGRYRSLMLGRDRTGQWQVGAASARWTVDGQAAGATVTLTWGEAAARPLPARRDRDYVLIPVGEKPAAWPSRVALQFQGATETFTSSRLGELASAVETCWSRFGHWRIEPLSVTADSGPYDRLPRITRDQRREMFSAILPPPANQPDDIYDIRGVARLGKMSGGLTETPAPGAPDWQGEVGGHRQSLRLVPADGVTREAAMRALAGRMAVDCPERDGQRWYLGRLVGPGQEVDWLVADCVAPDVHIRADALVAEMPGGELWLYHTLSDDIGVTTAAAETMRRIMLRARPDQEGGKQRLAAKEAAEAEKRFGPALAKLSSRQFAPIGRERWAATGPLSQRLCDHKWGPSTAAITCLRVFRTGEAATALLSRLRLLDADDCWPDETSWTPRSGSGDRAQAESVCQTAGRVTASRVYSILREGGGGGRLFVFVTYGSAPIVTLRTVDEQVRRIAGEALAAPR